MAPRTAYWASRGPVAPAMRPTLTDNTAPHEAVMANDWAIAARDKA